MANTKTRFSKILEILKNGIFADLADDINIESPTSEDVSELIEKLIAEKKKLAKKEQEEKRRREEAEAARKKQEELKRQKQHVDEITAMELPLDWDNAFECDPRTQGVHTNDISDALVLSLANLGKVDIEYMSAITGESYKTVICALKGSIYQNPETWEGCFYKGWETAEEYLSGNILRKWKSAQEANKKYFGYFRDNIEALSKVLPETVTAKDIYITLGSPWIPTDIIDDFVNHILKISGYSGTKHDEITGTWELPNKSFYGYKIESSVTFGTNRLQALYILEKTLNMKTVAVTDTIRCTANKSGEKRIINKAETVLALEKQNKLIAEFQDWVWKGPKRKERLETIFENNFGCVRRRVFDGSFLKFPTMNQDITLFPYQKNAVARILFSPNTLLAHDVGSGKTYIMIAAGMELKRIGISQKNLFVVPNNIVGQWHNIYKTLYPSAKILCVEPKTFTPTKREKMLKKIRDEEFDGIIMAYSCFEQIPISRDYFLNQLKKAKDEIEELEKDQKKSTARLRKKKEKIQKQISELVIQIDLTKNLVCFDELGITRLFVDEAHNYKNLPVETKVDRVLGISSAGSKKCRDMLDKVRIVQQNNMGGGVVMATGTPITNSITDAFILQKYLQNGELMLLDLQNFDSWVGMFAERVTEFEIDVDTNNYRLATRFAKFHNIPELTTILSSIADFHQVGIESGVPQFDGYDDALVGKTVEFAEYLDNISARADAVRNGLVNRKTDNMLKITTDGRKAALDLRLVDDTAKFTYQSKVARCAENIFNIYCNTHDKKGAQIVFCDTSIPKAGFNLYDELKKHLVNMGIPSCEIEFIHDATTEKSRIKLFERVRNGEVRVIIGSTFKLGLGVNIQDKLVALHHLDVPWRPADMTQREGRILRQGNTNQKINIYRYITEGSFDAYSWQLLESKQRFITGLLSGSMSERSGSDIEDTVLSYAEVKALAIGNPLIKRRVEVANELTRLLSLNKKAIDTHIKLEKELLEIPAKIERQKNLVDRCRNDIASFNENKKELDKEERKQLREKIFEAAQNNVLIPQETPLLEYQGFTIVMPANMNKEKPFVWLEKEGRYYVELGDTSKGGLIRIDNFLENFDEHLNKLDKALEEMILRKSTLEIEVRQKESYVDEIETCKKKLEMIDEKLGVKQ